MTLKLTLEEIHNGVTKKFKYKRNDTCKTCHGHGAMDITNCEVCNGNGVINRIMQTPIGVIQQSFPVIIVMVLVVRLLITVLTVMVLVVKVLKNYRSCITAWD
jgi:hypothetical protein